MQFEENTKQAVEMMKRLLSGQKEVRLSTIRSYMREHFGKGKTFVNTQLKEWELDGLVRIDEKNNLIYVDGLVYKTQGDIDYEREQRFKERQKEIDALPDEEEGDDKVVSPDALVGVVEEAKKDEVAKMQRKEVQE